MLDLVRKKERYRKRKTFNMSCANTAAAAQAAVLSVASKAKLVGSVRESCNSNTVQGSE